MLFLLLLLLSASGSTGLFTQTGYNGPWKWDISSASKCQLQLRWTAPFWDTASYLVLHWKSQHQHERGTGKGDGSSLRWSVTALKPPVSPCSEMLRNSSFVRETRGKVSLPDLQYFLFSWAVYFTQLTARLLQPAFRCMPAGHTGNCASRPGDFWTIGLRHLLHTCCTAGTWTELLILLFDFCIPVFKCCLCNLCLASPWKFGRKEPLYLNSLKCNISLGLIFPSF